MNETVVSEESQRCGDGISPSMGGTLGILHFLGAEIERRSCMNGTCDENIKIPRKFFSLAALMMVQSTKSY